MAVGYIPPRDKKGRPLQRRSNVAIDDSFRVRHCGIFKETIAASTSVNIDWQIPQLQFMGQDVTSLMVGVRYQIIGGEQINPPEIDFSALDKDGLIYPAGTVVDSFANSFYMFSDDKAEIREHKADLIPGFYIRASINNIGNQSITFICNLLRYIDTSGV